MIKIDISMPKGCGDCFACMIGDEMNYCICGIENKDVMHYEQLTLDPEWESYPEESRKPSWCPLEEVE